MTQMHHVMPPPPLSSKPPVPMDRIDQPIVVDSPIAYAVGDGYLHVGVVREVIHKVKDMYDYQRKQKYPGWTTRLKVEVEKETRYSASARYVNLTKLSNVVVLTGAAGKQVVEEVEESWVDTEG